MLRYLVSGVGAIHGKFPLRQNKMEQNKKDLLFEQINKISEVISTLSENFPQEEVDDEINFLSVVRDNLKDWGEKGRLDA